ncbi:MAG: ATP-binding cassette domain-containing protein [Kiritimatiellia bacterium]
MTISFLRTISSGEIWAVGGSDAVARGDWCWQVAHDEEVADETALLSFAQHAQEAQRAGGWPAARYYADEGKTVADFLSYEDVYDINPFAVGVRRAEPRRAFKARQRRIMRLLNLRRLQDRPMIALSNGEMRRTLFARALAKGPKILVLDDPAAGLDVKQRGRLKDILTALAARGLAIVVSYRHLDELPAGVTKWLAVDAKGCVKAVAKPGPAGAAESAAAESGAAARRLPRVRKPGKPVVEIRNLNVVYGARTLFANFSWTVGEGERWILRGENGSGKTTLMALITGDSPLAYAADIRVFGIARAVGSTLAKVRRHIGMVSPEMQACLGKSPFELLDDALRGRPKLLLLDEPFMNMEVSETRTAARKIAAYLKANPKAAAIMICHRRDEAPAWFNRELDLNG